MRLLVLESSMEPATLSTVKQFLFLISSAIYCGCFCSALAADDSAFVPSNPPEMKRLTNANSPAQLAAKWFMRGANLGDYLETPAAQNWSITVSAEEFSIMKREDFDHVRVPVRWSDYTGPGPDFKLSKLGPLRGLPDFAHDQCGVGRPGGL